MRRFTLLLFAVLLSQCLLYSQTAPPTVSKSQQKVPKSELIDLSAEQLVRQGHVPAEHLPNPTNQPANAFNGGARADCFDPYIPPDATYLPVPRNDDGSFYIADIGFDFEFCGTIYNDVWINTNGNISFTQGVGVFSPSGFPYNVPMVAPFWADVDTRNTACNEIVYKLFPNYMIVTWENVGWYNQQCNPTNTFQLIISDGTAPIIPAGNNIQFRYGDMAWTTGEASGGGPFGGVPATVGFNSGDNINYEQFGRFNLDNDNYDGPFGSNDGVDYLDGRCIMYNSGISSLDISCINFVGSLDGNCQLTVTPEDVSVLDVAGCSAATVTLSQEVFTCDDIGDNIITVTASNDVGQSASCTATVTILTGSCPATTIFPAGPFCESDPPTQLQAGPPGGSWSGPVSPSGLFDPAGAGPGIHLITYNSPTSCPSSASITIEVFSSPELTISPDPAEFCEEDGFVLLTATAFSGTPPYSTYNWSTPNGPQSGPIISAFFAGLYSVTITDANGCSAEAFTNVNVNPTPLVSIVDPGPICATESVVTLIGAPNGGTWAGDIVTPFGDIFPQIETPGIYPVTYTYMDGFGCMGTATINITITPTPNSFPSNGGPYCSGALIELFGGTDGIGSNISYSWTGPNGYTSSLQNPTDATDPGFYVLEVTVDGCISIPAATEVVINGAADAVALNGGPYCPGENIDLFGSTTATGNVITYEWNGPNAYSSFDQNPTDATESGEYILIVTVDGCPSTPVSTTVNFSNSPDVTAINTGPYCQGDGISLIGSTTSTGTTITYEWSGPNSYTSFDQAPMDATEAGDYQLIVTVDGCASLPAVTTVSINALPEPDITGAASFCVGSDAVLDAGVGYTDYVWTGNVPGQTLTVTSPGTYSVTVTDANGCTGVDAFVISQDQLPTPTITGADSFCEGGDVELDAGAGFTDYIWTGSVPGQTLMVTNAGTYSVTVTDANGCTGVDAFDVTENTLPTPIIMGDLDFCQGGNSVLDAGAGYTNYVWTDATTNQTITVDASSSVGVTVTDANGCTGETQVNITVFDNPTVNITGDDEICAGLSSTLNTDGTFNDYVWTTTESDPSIDVTNSGTYGVTVTDGNGCTGENTYNVTVYQNPVPTIGGSASFCSGFSTILDGGAGYTDYVWTGNIPTQTIEVSTGGTYGLTVTDVNGCTGETSIDVQESTSLDPNITGDLEYCIGDGTTLDAGAGFASYVWTGNIQTQAIAINTPGTYSVTVTDVNGCSGETSVLVEENDLPTVNIIGNTPICDGDQVTLDAGLGYNNYAWSDASLNQTLQVGTNGNYGVTVTDGNGCTNEDEVTVVVNANPTPVINGTDNFCSGDNVTLTTGAYTSYLWSDTSVESDLEVSVGGTYGVTVTDANGCSGETQYVVTENPLPEPEITGELEFCAGTSTTLSGPAGFTYQWSNTEATQTIEVTNEDTYDLIVTDANGCSGIASVQVIENALPEPDIIGSTTFCIGNSTTLNAGDYITYEWSEGSLTQSIEVDAEDTYAVTVTDANGCTAIDAVDVTQSVSLEPVIAGDLSLCEGETGVLDADGGFLTYQWSTTEVTPSIEVTTTGDYSVTVSDASGCTGETTVSFVMNANPVASIDGDAEICTGDNTILDGGTGFASYLWSDNTANQTLDVANGGNYSLTVTNAAGCSDIAFFSVNENPLPVPEIVGPPSFCSGNTATLSLSETYSTYSWSTGDNTESVTINTGQIVDVLVTDVNGCSNSTSVEVIENASLTPQIVGVIEFCEGDASTLDAGNGYATYEWSNGFETQTIEVSQSGNYGVVVTDADGCSGSTNVTVSINQNPEPVIAGSSTFCTGSFTTLDAGNYIDFLWSDNSSDQTITVNIPGNYSVTVTDANGCSGIGAQLVEESTSLNPVISGEPAFCQSDNTTLDAGAGFDSYEWSTGDFTQTVSVDLAGDYTVTVSDAQGCTGETTLSVSEIQPPSATLLPGTTLCNTEAGGSLVNLFELITAGDATGTWEDTDNSGAFGLYDNLDFNTITAGDYTFTYTTSSATAPCPEQSYTVTVTIIDCSCPDVTFFNADPLCNSDGQLDLATIENTAETGVWAIQQTPVGINPATIDGSLFDAAGADAGEYELSFTLTNMPPPGCPDVYTQFMTVEPEAIAGIPDLPVDYCADENENVSLANLLQNEDLGGVWTETSASPSQGGAFDPSTGSFTTDAQMPGSYTFNYEVAPGGACPEVNAEVEVIINALPTVEAGESVELACNDPVLALDANNSTSGFGYTIAWDGPGLVLDGSENTLEPNVEQAGMYSLVITNTQTGCSDTDVVEVMADLEAPTALAGDDQDITCIVTSVMLQSETPNSPMTEFTWDGPGINATNVNLPNPTVDIAGTYTLIITNMDNGCVSLPDIVNVLENNTDPTAEIQQSTAELNCNVLSLDLIGNSPNSDVVYEWLDENGNQIATTAVVDEVANGGVYTFVVLDTITGCSSSDIIEIVDNTGYPFASAGISQTIDCYNPEVTLDGSASEVGSSIIYAWVGPGISTPINSMNLPTTLPGMYIITVQNSENGCENSDTVMVDQNTITPDVVILTPEQLDCTVDEVNLDGSGSSTGPDFTYNWLDDNANTLGTTNNLVVDNSGMYSLVVTDLSNGCTSIDLVEVLENENVPEAVVMAIADPSCFDEDDGFFAIQSVIGGNGPYVYSFNDETFSSNTLFNNLTAGTYDLALEDANGCTWDTTIVLDNPTELILDLGTDLVLELGDSLTVDVNINISDAQIDTLIWTPYERIDCGNEDCTEIGVSTFEPFTLSATLIDIYGCTDEDMIQVRVNKDRRVFIPNVFSPNGDDNNDVFFINADDEQVEQIKQFLVYNRWGEIVYEGFNFQPNDPAYGWDGLFRDEPMNPAVFVYYAEIEFIDGRVESYKGDVTLVK